VGNESPDTLIVDGPNDTSVRFNFDVDVAGPDREWIAEGIRLAQDFVAAEFSDPMWEDVTVTVLPTGAPSDPGRIANTVAGSIAIYTGGEMAWAVAPPPERIRAVVHEYVHVYQYSLLDAELGVEVFANAPGWFVEGMAEYVSVKAVTQAGIVDQADYEVTQYVILASSPRVPALTELDSQIAFLQGDLSAYALSYFAFADLLDEQGFDAVDSLFSLLREGFGFEQAFEESFGQSTTAFYEEFALRQPTLTESVEPPEEFSTYIIERRSSPVTLVEAPDVLHAGDQVVYQATTEPGTICTLALEKPGASHPQLLQRESFANGQGDVYWLITVPANADRGDAQSILSCGGDQLTIDTPLA
jgi:Peptidase of plants and bacteria